MHPKVKDCAVIGIPDEQRGEAPKAYIVKKDHTLTETELSDFVKQKLSSYKWIEQYEFIESIPKLPSGKIQRKVLQKMSEADSDADTTTKSDVETSQRGQPG